MTPPRLPTRLLRRWLPAHLADAVAGDLAELFAIEAVTAPVRARLAYWRRTLECLWHLGRRPGRRHTDVPTGDPTMTVALRDLWHGLRLFATHPTYAWAAVVTLALAIGANTIIFTMANVLVLRPLPVADPDRLGWILTSGPNAPQDRAGLSLPEFAAFRDEVRAFTALAARRSTSAVLRDGDSTERVDRQLVVGDLHGVWGLRAVRGRLLASADEQPAAPPVTVLSHQFWKRRFAGADDAVGRTLMLDGQPRTIVGVLSADSELGNLSEIEVWTPWPGDPRQGTRAERGWRPTGRLAPGATVADAHAQVTAVAARLATEFPDTSRDFTSRVGTTRQALVGGGNVAIVLALLTVVVGLLLVLACANVMNLLIARLIGRQRELAVRTALGATRSRVVRQIVAESLAIGLVGGTLALGIAVAGLRGMRALSAEPFFQQLSVDRQVVAFAALLAFVAPLLFSIVPTLRLLDGDVRGALADASTRAIGGRHAHRGRAVLVVVQVSLAVTLLVVATLVAKSVRAVITADLGYDTTALLAAEFEVAPWMRAGDGAALALRQQLIERVAAMPGVAAVATASTIPSLTFPGTATFEVVGRPVTPRDRPAAGVVVTSPGYFAVTGTPIVAGRAFVPADASSPEPVVVVSADTARRQWGDAASALGRHLRIDGQEGTPALPARVIGVARDTANPDIDQPLMPQIFVLDAHRPARRQYLLVRSTAAATLAPALHRVIRDVDPDLAADIRTVEALFADEQSSNTLIGAMFAAFAVVAMLLATAGLYGVLAFVVSQRTPEIAVRMALGASRREVARDVVGRAARLAVGGIVIGLASGLALAQAMAAILYGVSPTDPWVYAGVGGLTLAAALVAAWIPMWRAATVDPIESLRQA